MIAALLAGWLLLPLAPYNPIEQDTLSSINLHFTVGLSSPSGPASLGPEISAKYEMLVIHPFVVRGALDGKYGRVRSERHPDGDLYTMTLSADAIYYRGTNHLTAYLGLGPVLAFHHFAPTQQTADSLKLFEQVSDVDVDMQWGYRLTLGLRYQQSYSVEFAITEIRPDFVKTRTFSDGGTAVSRHEVRTGSFRVTFGYLFTLRRF